MTPEARLRRIVAANRVRQERHARYLHGERDPRSIAALRRASERMLAEVRAGREEKLSLRAMARACEISVETISQMLAADRRRSDGKPPWPRPKHKRKTLVNVP